MKENPVLSVVMPVYNERETIEEIIRQVQAIDIDKEIVIVDDGSTDGSREYLRELSLALNQAAVPAEGPPAGWGFDLSNIRVFFQPENRGKGAAVRRGFGEAVGELVIIQDADLELDPVDYYELLRPIQTGRADVVFGSRYQQGDYRGVFLAHYIGVKLTTLLSNWLTGLRLTDIWTGYKVFRREVVQMLDLREDRFGFEPEVVVKVGRGRWRVAEVPVRYRGRTYTDGKKITKWDGLKGIWAILRYRFLS